MGDLAHLRKLLPEIGACCRHEGNQCDRSRSTNQPGADNRSTQAKW
jgi:hypothetical protein